MRKFFLFAASVFIFSATLEAQSKPEGSDKLLDAYRQKSALERLQPKNSNQLLQL